jgi:hypothetical protein
LQNPGSVILRPGGYYDDTRIVSGNISTIKSDEHSIKIYKEISDQIKKNFKKITGWYIGPNILKNFNSHIRLITMNINQSEIYDFKINDL